MRSRVAQYSETVRTRLEPDFKRAGVAYPPAALAYVGLKDEGILQVYAAGEDRLFRYIRAYPIAAASGFLGPKLREGDEQVPEGVYGVESLNPNSLFHLSIRVGYPNAFDRAKGGVDGRTNLGGDIMIHGGRSSVGCLAMGDPAAEDLFILAALAGVENVRVILSPVDFRVRAAPNAESKTPPWLPELYQDIAKALSGYPVAQRGDRGD